MVNIIDCGFNIQGLSYNCSIRPVVAKHTLTTAEILHLICCYGLPTRLNPKQRHNSHCFRPGLRLLLVNSTRNCIIFSHQIPWTSLLLSCYILKCFNTTIVSGGESTVSCYLEKNSLFIGLLMAARLKQRLPESWHFGTSLVL